MRLFLCLIALIAGLLPAAAGEPRFGPQAFEIFGTMEGAGGAAPGRPARFNSQSFQIFGGIDGRWMEGAAFWDNTEPRLAAMRPRVIRFNSHLPPGSILVRTGERKLYFILPEGQAVAYHVGVGREGFAWTGRSTVSRKARWPDWRPPPEMIDRERRRGNHLPEFVAGGPDNPLGARAIYIGNTQFRIHGTNEIWSIGQAVSSGCIRMMNADVIDLYNRVALGATVVVER
ncbi:MAG: L,D-transpeptidase [Aestuariivirga sp.]|uniref:L,D-transpeptidase n=1 Tax=Aestuariivirga sp. TaxID=2650926 RepID=UPI0038D014C0